MRVARALFATRRRRLIALALVVVIVVAELTGLLPGPDLLRKTYALRYVAATPTQAQTALFSPEFVSVLSTAYFLDSFDVGAALRALQARADAPAGTIIGNGWALPGRPSRVAEDGAGSVFFTFTSDRGSGVARLDTSSDELRFWPVEGAVTTEGIALVDGAVFFSSRQPLRMHRLDPPSGTLTSWELGDEDGAPSVRVTFWKVGERAAHPRKAPDGRIVLSNGRKLSYLDPRTGTVTAWETGFGLNGLAVSESGVIYAVVSDFLTEGLLRFEPGTGAATTWCGDFGVTCNSLGLKHLATDGRRIYAGGYRDVVIVDPERPSSFTIWEIGADVGDLSVNPDGSVYLTDAIQDAIVLLEPEAGRVTRWKLPTEDSGVNGIYVDETTGLVYFAEAKAHKIGRLDPRRNLIREWRAPGVEPEPLHLKKGADGRIYFTARTADSIVAVDPSSPGADAAVTPERETVSARVVTDEPYDRKTLTSSTYQADRSDHTGAFGPSGSMFELAFSTLGIKGRPHDLTPDGGYVALEEGAIVWLDVLESEPTPTELARVGAGVAFTAGTRLGVFDPDSGVATLWNVAPHAEARVTDVAATSEGTLFFSYQEGIGRLDPGTSALTRWTLGPADSTSVRSLAIDHRGRIWYGDAGARKVGRLDPRTAVVSETGKFGTGRNAPGRMSANPLAVAFLERGEANVSLLPLDDGLVPMTDRASRSDTSVAASGARTPAPRTARIAPSTERLARRSMTSRLSVGTAVTVETEGGHQLRDIRGATLAGEASIFQLPLGAEIIGPAADSSVKLGGNPLLDRVAEAEDALADVVAAEVQSKRSLVAESWRIYTRTAPLAATDTPTDESLIVLGDTVDDLIALLETQELARHDEFIAAGTGGARAIVARAADPAYANVADAMRPELSEGSVAVVGLILPYALPDLPSLAGAAGQTDVSARLRSAMLRLRDAATRFDGQARKWATQDGIFELLLNLKRLGGGSDPATIVARVATAESLALEYLERLSRPVPPIAKVAAHLVLERERSPYPPRLQRAFGALPGTLRTAAETADATAAAHAQELASLKTLVLQTQQVAEGDRQRIGRSIDDAAAAVGETRDLLRRFITTAKDAEREVRDSGASVAYAQGELIEIFRKIAEKAREFGPVVKDLVQNAQDYGPRIRALQQQLQALTAEHAAAEYAAQRMLAPTAAMTQRSLQLQRQIRSLSATYTLLQGQALSAGYANLLTKSPVLTPLITGLGVAEMVFAVTGSWGWAIAAGVLVAIVCSGPFLSWVTGLAPAVGLGLSIFCLLLLVAAMVYQVGKLVARLRTGRPPPGLAAARERRIIFEFVAN